MKNHFRVTLLVGGVLMTLLYLRDARILPSSPRPYSPPLAGESPEPVLASDLREVELEEVQRALPELSAYGFCGAQNRPGFTRPRLRIDYNPALGALYRKVKVGEVDLEDSYATLKEITRSPKEHMEALVLFGLWLRGDRKHRQSQGAFIEALRGEAPISPAIYLQVGLSLADTPHTAWALRSLRSYLQHFPKDAVISQRAARLEVLSEILQEFTLLSNGNINLYFPEELPSGEGEALLDQSQEVLEEAAELLDSPPHPDLTVIVFHDRSELLATSCSPIWAVGRFDGMVKLFLDSHRPDHRGQILRHELLHAQLAGMKGGRVPSWLEEGLAQVFAGQTRGGGHHLKRMVEHKTMMPLASLSGSLSELEQSSDAEFAYTQSRLMVMYAMEKEGEGVIGEALDYLQANEPLEGLWEHMTEDESLLSGGFLDFVASEIRH